MLTLDKIYHASYVLKNIIYRTELIYAPNISQKCNIFLKPENLQLTGSFKVRGSYYKISQLSEEEKDYDRRTSVETLKFIISQGYDIVK